MDTKYQKCDTCGCPILSSTHSRNQGLCKKCWQLKQVKLKPRIEYPPERFDPLDTDDEFRWLIEKVDNDSRIAAIAELNENFPEINATLDDPGMGFCHLMWHHKKRILKDDHGIEWSSPAELNPHIWYD